MLGRRGRAIATGALLLCAVPACWAAVVGGHLSDTQGKPVDGALVRLLDASGNAAARDVTHDGGAFTLDVPGTGRYELAVSSAGFADFKQSIGITQSDVTDLQLQFQALSSQRQAVTVTADVGNASVLFPDPAQRVFVREDILDANPGRPGAPISIPGLPIESASGGIKAPQYFAPGVAGDHGEPIATFWQVGSYLAPNNLSANAHGNGYSDPNIIVSAIIEAVQTDGGAFNVREGNHSVNAAEIYSFHSRLTPFVTLTGDSRDIDASAGWSPGGPETRGWLAVEAAYGNGFLDRLEHRQQYKLNGYRVWEAGKHELTLFGVGYYGISKIPGLTPIDIPNLHDTIDPRQRDETHTAELTLNDVWTLSRENQFQFSMFLRTYSLALDSNFGDGLIRQSEFRTEQGGNATYIRNFGKTFSLLTGLDYFRDAPRRLDLDHYLTDDANVYGPFEKVTANDVTLNFLTPFAAVEMSPWRWMRLNLGWRRDEIDVDNQDLLRPANSSQSWVGVNSPKATLSLTAPENSFLPSASFSFGQTFFTNDPRMGNGTMEGTRVSRAHSLQLVLAKDYAGTDFRVTFGRVTQEASLAKIDPDTGLQFDEGPSRNLYMTVSARHQFSKGSLQASFSKADARDLSDGTPTPEAPRLIADALGTLDRLPWHLHARAEFEYVGSKPLGDGFDGTAVREFRGALVRPFLEGRIDAGVNFLIASGFSGQTTEVLALPGEAAFERVVGVYIPSYATVSFTYHPQRRNIGGR